MVERAGLGDVSLDGGVECRQAVRGSIADRMTVAPSLRYRSTTSALTSTTSESL
jgi:hypothetical protein